MKKKKLTIKPFLNTYLDSVGTSMNGNEINELYSLYYKITYDRKNTQLKSYYSLGFSNLDDYQSRDIIAFETKILMDIVNYEISLDPQKEYNIAGLKKKYEVYVMSVYQVMDAFLRDKLKKASLKTKSIWHTAINFNPSGQINVLDLLEICCRIFPNFDNHIDQVLKKELESFQLYHRFFADSLSVYSFATIIDWKNGSHVEVVEKTLSKYLKNRNKVNSTIQIIDGIVSERTKNLIS